MSEKPICCSKCNSSISLYWYQKGADLWCSDCNCRKRNTKAATNVKANLKDSNLDLTMTRSASNKTEIGILNVVSSEISNASKKDSNNIEKEETPVVLSKPANGKNAVKDNMIENTASKKKDECKSNNKSVTTSTNNSVATNVPLSVTTRQTRRSCNSNLQQSISSSDQKPNEEKSESSNLNCTLRKTRQGSITKPVNPTKRKIKSCPKKATPSKPKDERSRRAKVFKQPKTPELEDLRNIIRPKPGIYSGRNISYKGQLFTVGDIVAVRDVELNKYYCQLRGFMIDQYCEKTGIISWLLPTNKSPPPKQCFDPATYVMGMDEDIPRKMECFEFVMHAPPAFRIRNGHFPPPHCPGDYRNIYVSRFIADTIL